MSFEVLIILSLCLRCINAAIYQNCGGTADGWYAPTGTGNPLGTFEVNCYYFAPAPGYYWDQAFKACIDLGSGSKLAVFETNTEFNWIISMYTSLYSAYGGFYVDATQTRYGSNYLIPAWRGGTSLSSGVGSVITGTSITTPYAGCWGSGTPTIYNHAFYLNKTGYLLDIFERSSIPTNGGYLCKKFRTASYPPTIAYNLAYGFPSLGSSGACPAGWTSFTPNAQAFCYYPVSQYYANHDETYRQCHALGADLAYLESTTEYNMMVSNGWIGTNTIAFNGNRFRYGPFGLPNSATSLTWSSGVTITSGVGPYGVSLGGGQPDDACSTESALQLVSGSWLNDITPYLNIIGTSVANYQDIGICKRPAKVNAYYCNSQPNLALAGTQALNTVVQLQGYTYALSCAPGYVTYTTCSISNTWYGYWSTPNSNCVVYNGYCTASTAPTLSNAWIPTPATYLGGISYFTCVDGYQSTCGTTSPNYQCNVGTYAAGVWSTVNCTCVPIASYCSLPAPTLANATITATTTVWSVSQYTPVFGFKNTGPSNPYVTCNAYNATIGSWSAITYGVTYITTYCDTASAPTTPFADYPDPQTRIGWVTYFTCNNGYTPAGGVTPSYTCLSSTSTAGTWSAVTSSCTTITTYCALPAPTLANADTPTASQVVFTSTSFTCNDGYVTSATVAPYYTCLPNTAAAGIWSTVVGNCAQISNYCPFASAPTLAFANSPTPQTTIGAITTFTTCSLGYQSSLSPAVPYYSCQHSAAATGTWSGVTGTCDPIPAYCNSASTPTLAHAVANASIVQTTIGSSMSFVCNDGYASTGGLVAPYYTCLASTSASGQWSSVQFSCVLINTYCALPIPWINNADPVDYTIDQTINGVNNFTCAFGYESSGGTGTTPYFTCLDYNATAGIWSDAIYSCQQVVSTSVATTTIVFTTTVGTYTCGSTCIILLSMLGIAGCAMVALVAGVVVVLLVKHVKDAPQI